ncbi:MAG: hypothetical protein HY943_17065 [Gammaproteobacteria bacterium]|nr:hypothetical protein [Gammaproteobacteria bacterium]
MQGDILKLCGYHHAGSGPTHYIAVQASRIHLDGDCSANRDLPRAVIDGDSERYSGISTGTSYGVTIEHIEVLNTTARGIYASDSTGSMIVDRSIVIDSVYVHDIKKATTAVPTGIFSHGRNITIKNSVIASIGDDGISHMGKGLVLQNVSISNPGIASTTGDCVAASGEVDGLNINDLTCDHTNVDEKQCIVISNVTDAPHGTISNVNCMMPMGAKFMTGLTVHQGTWNISGVYTRGGNIGMSFENSFGTITATKNVVVGATTACYRVEWNGLVSTSRTVLDGNVARLCGAFGVHVDNTSSGISVTRNVVKGAGRCLDIFYAGQAHSQNTLLDCSVSTTSANKVAISNDPTTLSN